MVVHNIFQQLAIPIEHVLLGEVQIGRGLTTTEKDQLEQALQLVGFELIDDKRSRMIEKMKNIIIQVVHAQDNNIRTSLSDMLSSQLQQDYNYLSHLFSDVEGTTIEKYFIAQKIERVKELLVYDELTLSEIAYKLNYSSVAYLSNQFKKVTGLSPSHFKNIKEEKRKPIDSL